MNKHKTIAFVLVNMAKGNTAYIGARFPSIYSIPTETVILKNGRPTRIRYAKGEDTIYVDEQSDFASSAAPIHFIDGFKYVSEKETVLLKYMRAAFNQDNDNRVEGRIPIYRELDYEKEAKTKLDKDLEVSRAERIFFDLQVKPDIIRAIARMQGIEVTSIDSSIHKGILLNNIRSNPKDFLELVDDSQKLEQATRLDLIYETKDRGFIQYGLGKWFWKNGGSDILEVPTGLEAHKYLAEYTLSESKGKILAEEFKGLVNDNPIEVEMKEKLEATQEEREFINGMSHDELLKQARAYGVIEYLADERKFIFHIDEEKTILGNSKKNCTDKMRSDAAFLNNVRRELVLARRKENNE